MEVARKITGEDVPDEASMYSTPHTSEVCFDLLEIIGKVSKRVLTLSIDSYQILVMYGAAHIVNYEEAYATEVEIRVWRSYVGIPKAGGQTSFQDDREELVRTHCERIPSGCPKCEFGYI